jgi:hypothetical protein
LATIVHQWQWSDKPTPELEAAFAEQVGRLINARLVALFSAQYVPKNQRREVYQLCWQTVLRRLHNYDPARSKVSTFIYLCVDMAFANHVCSEVKQQRVRAELVNAGVRWRVS